MFLLPMLIPSIDCKLHKRCPKFEWIAFCPGYMQCKPYEGFKMNIAAVHSWWNVAKSDYFFLCEKNAW